MPAEIERKFLVTGSSWADNAGQPVSIRQAYVALSDRVSVRVRIKGGHAAFLTIKSAAPTISRVEVEVPIPAADAEELLALRQGAVIEKQRYRVPFGGLVWDVDVFGGENAGLVIAEVEVPAADHAVALPDWAGTEVTGDARYYNAQLASDPISGTATGGAA
ncbi:MAG TPA: CYTH domain-containing protein [Thalassobaculum sp.]